MSKHMDQAYRMQRRLSHTSVEEEVTSYCIMRIRQDFFVISTMYSFARIRLDKVCGLS